MVDPDDGRVTASRFLAAYDAQLRGDAETRSALAVVRLGPVLAATLTGFRPGHSGFVTAADLDAVAGAELAGLVPETLAHFASDPDIHEIEWKTRAHDHTPGLHEALVAHGFVPGEPESIMIGEAAALAVEVPLPDGITVRRAVDEGDVRAATAMQDEVFGEPVSVQWADEMLRRLAGDETFELWIAEHDGVVVAAGRVEPAAGSEFASIWGGAARPEWRGRGIYRALTSARARVAIARGKTLIHSDSTEFSRPILQRSGLIAVSTTTPYLWTRSVESPGQPL